MFQNKHFNPNYTQIREEWGRGLKVGIGFDFSMQFIFWNNLFKGTSLLKQAKYFAPQIRIWHLGVLTKQKFIIISRKPDTSRAKGKNGRVHPINFCGWPSKIFHDLLKFRRNPFLHFPENVLLNRYFLLCLFEIYFDIWLTAERSSTDVNYIHLSISLIYLNEIISISKFAWANFYG